MIERIGIATLCGVFLYGYVQLFSEHLVLAIFASVFMAAGVVNLLQDADDCRD